MDMAAILHGFLKIVNKFKTIDFSGGTPIGKTNWTTAALLIPPVFLVTSSI
jgi:hypothetical protein